jgi:hypothetical protein
MRLPVSDDGNISYLRAFAGILAVIYAPDDSAKFFKRADSQYFVVFSLIDNACAFVLANAATNAKPIAIFAVNARAFARHGVFLSVRYVRLTRSFQKLARGIRASKNLNVKSLGDVTVRG